MAYLKVAIKVDLKSYHHKEKKLRMVTMLARQGGDHFAIYIYILKLYTHAFYDQRFFWGELFILNALQKLHDLQKVSSATNKSLRGREMLLANELIKNKNKIQKCRNFHKERHLFFL